MLKRVMITVESRQEHMDGEVENLSFVTEGTLLCEAGLCEITYQESEMTGMAGTTTTLKVEKGSVLLIRHGTLSSILVFEKGKTHYSGYDTEFGSFQIGVTARRVEVEVVETGGHLQVDYTMEFNGAQGGRHTIRVDVRTKEQA